ncbi:hypothetical protein N7474_010052 [Penicillium riverlandense]|uniref:uncharacterized protein n=1 Tax=Penicillium riverlandense TaxID=1903569 RepID=UPI0025491E23|nr:uncharacterized protein N7474_010052 [Penicillium riverlandense]KAJ5808783.1 hypothetical protein N7474_010052 [Penicillium riverlandense]
MESPTHPPDYDPRIHYHEAPVPLESHGHAMNGPLRGRFSYPLAGHPLPPAPMYHHDWNHPSHMPRESQRHGPEGMTMATTESQRYILERNIRRSRASPQGGEVDDQRAQREYHHTAQSQRRSSVRDEFDGPYQLLDPPSPRTLAAQEKELPELPTNLDAAEQDKILHKVNDRLSQCAFDFVARYQFRIPIEADKRIVKSPSDREWTEWVHLLKRLATTRRIPARILYNGQIKQLITVLENSLEMRHAAKHQSRPVKDDRNVLQLISAGTQVARILKDPSAMYFLDRLYVETEKDIQERGSTRRVRFRSNE